MRVSAKALKVFPPTRILQKKNIGKILLPVAVGVCLLGGMVCMLWPSPKPEHYIGEPVGWNMNIDQPIKPLYKIFVSYDLDMAAANAFSYGIVVEAKIVEILPDVYTRGNEILGSDRWHMLRMKTLDVVAGKNMPREFYLMLPADYSTNLSRFDSFLLTLSQRGFDTYTLINTDQRRYESFSPVFSPVSLDPDNSEINGYISTPNVQFGILAFRNGFLDMSLWDADVWDNRSRGERLLASETVFPVEKGASLAEAKLGILLSRWQNRKYIKNRSIRYCEELEKQPAGILAEYLDAHAFDQRFYRPNGHPLGERYRRLINGFQTNECYLLLQDGTIEDSPVKFTEEEIATLPDLEAVLRDMTAQMPENSTETTCLAEVRAGYHKENDKVFGYVRLVWGDYRKNREVCEKNLFIYPDGTVEEVTPEKWTEFKRTRQ